MAKSTFNIWFKAQFGSLPKSEKWFLKQHRITVGAKRLWQAADFRLEREIALHNKHTAALYAWQASEKKGK